jgi:hypothetical protein
MLSLHRDVSKVDNIACEHRSIIIAFGYEQSGWMVTELVVDRENRQPD